MNNHVHAFLSYAPRDLTFASKLANDLYEQRFYVWMESHSLKVDEDPSVQIRQAIERCNLCIIVLSSNYVENLSHYEEILYALELGRVIVPVLVETIREESLFCLVRDRDYIDFRDWRSATQYSEKLKSLVTTLRNERNADTPGIETKYLYRFLSDIERQPGLLEYVPLQAEFSDVHEGASQSPDGGSDQTKTSLMKEKVRQTEQSNLLRPGEDFLNIEEAANFFTSFVILGDPGAGKTTALRRLALQAAMKRLKNPSNAPVPLFISIKNWKDKETPETLVRNHWPFDSDPKDLLKRGNVALYLDGLDEMGELSHEKAPVLAKWLSENVYYFYLTCRLKNYIGRLNMNLPMVVIKAMDDQTIRQYAEHYLKDNALKFIEWLFARDDNKQDNTRQLEQLARNPFLLAALINIYAQNISSGVPDNPGRLFSLLVKNLWQREEDKGASGWLPLVALKEALGRFAFKMIDEKRANGTIDWVVKQITGDSWLETPSKENEEKSRWLLTAAASANLIRIEGNTINFSHDLLKEYFAAEGLLSVSSLGKLAEAHFPYIEVQQDESENGYSIQPGRYLGKWDQVVIACCGIEDPDKVVRHVLTVDPILAARCIESGAKVSSTIKNKVVDYLFDAFFFPNETRDRRWTGAAQLDALRKEEPELAQFIPNEKEWIRHICIQALCFCGEAAAPRLVTILQDTNDTNIKHSVLSALAIIGPASIPSLVQLLKSADDQLRPTLLSALILIGSVQPDKFSESLASLDTQSQTIVSQSLAWAGLPLRMDLGDPGVSVDINVHDGAASLLSNISKEIPDLFEKLINSYQVSSDARTGSAHASIILGDLHYLSERYDMALSFYSEAAVISPDNDIIQALFGDILVESGNIDEAIEAYKKAISLSKKNHLYYEKLVQIYIQQNKFNKAISVATDLVEIADDAFSLNLRGVVRTHSGNNQSALIDFGEAIAKDPKDPIIYTNRAETYAQIGSTEEAIADYSKALALWPQDPEFLNSRGVLYTESGQYQKAMDDFNRALEIESSATILYTNLAVAKQSLGLTEEAMADVDRALDLKPDDIYALERRGLIKTEKSEFQMAIEDFTAAIEAESNYHPVYAARADAYLAMEQYDQALADIEYAIKLNADDATSILIQGNIHSGMGNHQLAIDAYSRVINIQSDNYSAYAFRAYSHLDMQNYDQALADIEHAIKLNADDVNSMVIQGDTHIAMEKYEQALEDYNHAIKLEDDNPEHLISRALVNLKLGNFKEALKDFDHAIALQSDRGTHFHFRALAHIDLGNYESALADLEHSDILEKEDDTSICYNLMWRGLICNLTERYEDAQQIWEKAMMLAETLSDKIDKHRLLGLATMFLGDIEASQVHHKQIFEHNPAPYFLYMQGNYLQRAKRLFPERTEIGALIDWFEQTVHLNRTGGIEEKSTSV